jgi:hypothetical protein
MEKVASGRTANLSKETIIKELQIRNFHSSYGIWRFFRYYYGTVRYLVVVRFKEGELLTDSIEVFQSGGYGRPSKSEGRRYDNMEGRINCLIMVVIDIRTLYMDEG